MRTATIRDLRTRFPAIRTALQKEGEVIITERGKASYTLRTYHPAPAKKPAAVDYWQRLKKQQPTPLSLEASQDLDQANREDR